MTEVDWSRWTVILCKPDCAERGLIEVVLERIAEHVTLTTRRELHASEQQILAHYADMVAMDAFFPFDTAAALRRRYVGALVTVALGYGPDAAARVRAQLGHYNPAMAPLGSIRGDFGTDSHLRARAEDRFIDNLIHTSDDPPGAEREFAIWFGPAAQHLLTPPSSDPSGAEDATNASADHRAGTP
ncbi:MAG: hypothetical protein GEV11_09975 [Streptosporangiales bacterium]|nr:hypothetical protein [Streptosporangiales bacterium]